MTPPLPDAPGFLRTARHDLDASFRMITVLSQWIAEDISDPDAISLHLKDMDTAMMQATRLTEMLGHYAQVVLHAPRPEPIDIREALEVCLTRHGIAPDGLPAGEACVDAWLFAQILGALVDNAVQHGRALEQGLAVSLSGGQLTLSDQGPGIPPHWIDRVHAPFVKFATSKGPAGSGLGLTLAHHAARACGLALSLSSPPDGGLSVHIKFD